MRLEARETTGWQQALSLWAGNVPKGKEGLITRIEQLARVEAAKDQSFQAARGKAEKWFKQGEKYEDRAAADIGSMAAAQKRLVDKVAQDLPAPPVASRSSASRRTTDRR